MPRHRIDPSWSLDLPYHYDSPSNNPHLLFYTPGRTIYATTYPARAATAEESLAEYLNDLRAKPLQSFSRRAPGLVAEAHLLPEGPPGKPYYSLNTWTASDSSVACVTFYFDHLDDLPWAMEIWHSIHPTHSPIPQA